jgi:uncharacterized protein
MKLLVSIHDVTPAYRDEVRALHHLCAARQITPALLVVPNWHGVWPLEGYQPFVSWLRDRAAEGADVMLHGVRHDEAGLTRRLVDEARAFGRTAREAEFLTLDRSAASARIRRGLDVLHRSGLDPIGFVPPAWLWHADGPRAVAAAGLRLSEDDRAIHLHDRGVSIASPVVRWSARSSWRAHVSALVASARTPTLHWRGVARIALHPRDVDHPATLRSLASTMDAAVAHGTPWRYGSL